MDCSFKRAAGFKMKSWIAALSTLLDSSWVNVYCCQTVPASSWVNVYCCQTVPAASCWAGSSRACRNVGHSLLYSAHWHSFHLGVVQPKHDLVYINLIHLMKPWIHGDVDVFVSLLSQSFDDLWSMRFESPTVYWPILGYIRPKKKYHKIQGKNMLIVWYQEL